MRVRILNKLREIEKNHSIKILYACESGSRGWGFPSPDSDYDVRFIYTRHYNDYLSIIEQNDQFNFAIDDELDINGWDIRKVLQLIKKSNTTPFEWLQSPIIYIEEPGFKEELWNISQNYFCPKSNIFHYLGIAKNALSSIKNENEIKIKKLFYVLRPLLSAKWCLEKNGIAPMTITPLMDLLPVKLANYVSDLIKLKETADEGFIIEIDLNLKNYVVEEINYCIEGATFLEKQKFSTDALDYIFRKKISNHDN